MIPGVSFDLNIFLGLDVQSVQTGSHDNQGDSDAVSGTLQQIDGKQIP